MSALDALLAEPAVKPSKLDQILGPAPPQGFASAPSEATAVSPIKGPPGLLENAATAIQKGVLYPANTLINLAASRMESGLAGAAAPLARMAVKNRIEEQARQRALAAPRSAISAAPLTAYPGALPSLPDRLRPIENVMGALRGTREAISGAAKGLVTGTPPERAKIVPNAVQPYEPTEAFNQMLRWEGGVPPVPAALIDLAASVPAGEALATVAKPAVGALKMVGRAAEPLRRVKGIKGLGDLVSPAFSIPALKPGESKLDYILGNLPDNQRAVFRGIQKRAAGEAAFVESQRNDLMQVADHGRKEMMKRLTITPEEAQDILRTAAEEEKRLGPKALQGMTEPEIAGVRAMQAIPKLEVSSRVKLGMRANELASHVEKRAQIAEQRIQRAKGPRSLAAHAKGATIPTEWLPNQSEPIARAAALKAEARKLRSGANALGPDAGAAARNMAAQMKGKATRAMKVPPTGVSPPPAGELKWLEGVAKKAETKARRSVGKFENVSGVGMPRSVQSRRIDLPESEKLLAKRGEFFVDYQPRVLGKGAREAQTGARYGGTPIEYSTTLGRRRGFKPTVNTAEADAKMLETMAQNPEKRPKVFGEVVQQNRPEGQMNVATRNRFGDEALGDKPRYFEEAFKALRKNGINRDASLEHGYLISHVAKNFGEDAYRPGLKSLGDLPFLSGFDKNSKAALSKKWIPESMWDLMSKASSDGARNYGAIEAAARASLRYWKPLVTLTRPEFWVRNWAWSKYIRGVYGDINPMNDKFGIDLVARTTPEKMVTVGARQMSMAQLHDEFVKGRIIAASKAVDVGKAGAAGRAYQGLEDSQRAGYAWHWLKRGKTIEQASEEVRHAFFNYGPEAFTPFEQKYLREGWFPFWAWPRNIVRLSGRVAGERPGAFGQLGILQNSVSRAMGYSAEDQNNFGEMYKTSGAIPLTTKAEADKTGKIKMFSLSGLGMVNDVNTLIGMRERGGMGPFDGVMSQLHPLASGFINLWFNPLQGRWVNGGSIRDEMKGPVKQVKLPQVAKLFAGKLPGIKTVALPDGQTEVIGPNVYSAVFRSVGNVPNVPFEATDPDWKDYMLAVKYATGIPISELDFGKARHYGYLDRREQKQAERTLHRRDIRLEHRIQSGR